MSNPVCKARPNKRRVAKHHKGRPSDFRKPLKRHGWEGHGPDRRCRYCGYRPGHITDNIPNGEKKWRKAQEVRKHVSNS